MLKATKGVIVNKKYWCSLLTSKPNKRTESISTRKTSKKASTGLDAWVWFSDTLRVECENLYTHVFTYYVLISLIFPNAKLQLIDTSDIQVHVCKFYGTSR